MLKLDFWQISAVYGEAPPWAVWAIWAEEIAARYFQADIARTALRSREPETAKILSKAQLKAFGENFVKSPVSSICHSMARKSTMKVLQALFTFTGRISVRREVQDDAAGDAVIA